MACAKTHGDRRWELDQGATLYDVTHLACRSARYTPVTVGGMLAGPREAVGVSRCTRRRDASGRGLREAKLCGAHCDRRGRGRLNCCGVPTACAATAIKDSRYHLSIRNYTSHPPVRLNPPPD
ncbi:MAG: hypothetical protein U0236_17705 [Nitrospira sp.]